MPIASRALVCRNTWHSLFLALLPQIRNYVVPVFRHLRRADQDDAVQNAICHAFAMFLHLMRDGREHLIYPTVLANFAVRHVREGRSFGTRTNSGDMTSLAAQRRRESGGTRPVRSHSEKGHWIEALIEDHRTPVIDQVWFRIDYPDWLSQLSRRRRRIAESLAEGNATNSVARQFCVSEGRISQIRRELFESWELFQAEKPCLGSRF
jgi:hypothetical protein